MFITRPHAESDSEARSLGHGMWHCHLGHSPFPKRQAVFIVTVRLPSGARLLEADPLPHKSSARTGRTALTWRILTDIVDRWAGETGLQFEADLDYALLETRRRRVRIGTEPAQAI